MHSTSEFRIISHSVVGRVDWMHELAGKRITIQFVRTSFIIFSPPNHISFLLIFFPFYTVHTFAWSFSVKQGQTKVINFYLSLCVARLHIIRTYIPAMLVRKEYLTINNICWPKSPLYVSTVLLCIHACAKSHKNRTSGSKSRRKENFRRERIREL